MTGDKAFEDWRARMALRGGPMSHSIARAGWLVFGALGALLMVGAAALYAANPGENGADNGAGANFVGGLIVMMPIGAVLGGLLGLLAQFGARSWLRTPTAAERLVAREEQERSARAAREVTGLAPSGRWSRSYEACAKSVRAFHSIAGTLPEGAGRDWFTTIASTLDDELNEALRLARLGESLDTSRAGNEDLTEDAQLATTKRTVANLLVNAEKSFAETTGRAAAIALDLRENPDFTHVRAQLDMLRTQAPNLKTETP